MNRPFTLATTAFVSGFFLSGSTFAFDQDVFADVIPKPVPVQSDRNPSRLGFEQSFFSDNFGFKKEWMSEFGLSDDAETPDRISSRQSIGFEVLKKFSTVTRTFASINLQARAVRRDGFVESPNDMEGMDRGKWFLEYHNVYADLYDFLNPILPDDALGSQVGRFNLRFGRFYVPFGLNLQTDTHGTVLQLSNERNFGFERDWYAGFWGTLTEDLRYDVYYLMGSGYDFKNNGQSGLGAARFSLANKYASEYGLEAGWSILGGQRIAPDAVERSHAVMDEAGQIAIVDTLRTGLDARYRRVIPGGVLTWTSEVSGGKDEPDSVVSQLHQADFLHSSRHWGFSTQYRWFWQDMDRSRSLAPRDPRNEIDASVLLEATWYFQNDVANSNLHWIKANCEVQLDRQRSDSGVIWTIQYYRYF